MRRLAAGLIGGALLVAACGDEQQSTDTAPATEAPVATNAPEPAPEPAPAVADEPAPEPEPAPADEPAPEPEAAPADEPAPEPTTTPAPEPDAPALGGRELGETVRAESTEIANPLPDLLVDDVRRGVKANTANILPSDRPVLVWAWAPH